MSSARTPKLATQPVLVQDTPPRPSAKRAAVPDPADDDGAGSGPSSKRGRPRKFDGKPVEEVLAQHGLDKIRQLEASIAEAMSTPCFDVMNFCPAQHNDACAKLLSIAKEHHKAASALATKVSKWTLKPDGVQSFTGKLKNVSLVVSQAATVFMLDKRKGFHPDKMEQSLAALEEIGYTPPVAFRTMYFAEHLCELGRFYKTDDIVNFANASATSTTGYWADLVADGRWSEVEGIITDNLADFFANLVGKTKPKISDACKEIITCIADLAGRRNEFGVPAIVQDLSHLATALGWGGPTFAAQRQARQWLRERAHDRENYTGILKVTFAENQWQVILDWCAACGPGEEVQLVVEQLSASFDKLQAQPFLSEDKRELEENLKKAFAAVVTASDEGQRHARSYLLRLLPGLLCLARANAEQLNTPVAEVCAACEPPASGSGEAPLRASVKVNRAVMEYNDIMNRCDFDLAPLMRDLGTEIENKIASGALKGPVDDFSDLAREIRDKTHLFVSVVNAAKAHLVTSKTLPAERAAEMTAPLLVDSQTLEPDIVDLWCKVTQAKVASSVPEEVCAALTSLESRLGLQSACAEAYQAKLGCLKQSALALADAFLQSMPDSEKKIEEDIQAAAKQVRDQKHETMQACTWSATPAYDRSCIELVSDVFSVVCVAAPEILHADAQGATYTPTDLVDAAFASMTNLEKTKPLLSFVFEQAMLDKLMEKVLAVNGKLVPLQASHDMEFATKLTAQLGKLHGMLVAEDPREPIAITDFHSELSQKDVRAIKELRAQSKETLKSMSKRMVDASGALVLECETATELAKCQTFKWGLAQFLSKAEIKFQTEVGRTLRAKLKEVWEMDSLDAGVLEYLGKDVRVMVKDIIGMDKKQAKDMQGSGGKTGAAKGKAQAAGKVGASSAASSSGALPGPADPVPKRRKPF